MKHALKLLVRLALLSIILIIWLLTIKTSFSDVINLTIIIGGVILTYPVVWLGRRILDRHHSKSYAEWVTTFVHVGLAFTFGIPIVLLLTTYKHFAWWILPVPKVIGLILVIITGAITFLTVANLALKGFGAPFFIALSKKLASDWMYAWTRNPMVLAALTFFLSLAIWFQSIFCLLWVIIVFAPALLFFVKVFEEKELEFRFGQSYLDYKSRTPMLFPGKPGKRTV